MKSESQDALDPIGNNDNTGDQSQPQQTSPSKQLDPEHEYLSDRQKGDGKDLDIKLGPSQGSIDRQDLNSSNILPEIQLGGSIQAKNVDTQHIPQNSSNTMFKRGSQNSIQHQNSVDPDKSLDGSKQGLLKNEEAFLNGIDAIQAQNQFDQTESAPSNIKNAQILPYNSIDSHGSQKDAMNRSEGDIRQRQSGGSSGMSSNGSLGRGHKQLITQKHHNKTLNAVALQEAMETNERQKRKDKWSYKATTCKEQLPIIKKKLGAAVDANLAQGVMTIVTIYALLASDIKSLSFEVEADKYFVGLTIASMMMFLLELICASIGKDGYWLSFFFWLDLIATVSLVTDIDPLVEAFSGGNEDGGSGATDTATLARASRGARIGTRAGRMTRVIRLIRLIRVVKLYKSANQAIENKDQAGGEQSELKKLQDAKLASQATKNMDKESDSDAQEEEEINIASALLKDQMESKVGKKLSDITTRKVIILVLAMLFSSVAFKSNTYLDEPDSFDYGLCLIQTLGVSTSGGTETINTMIEIQSQLPETPLVYLSLVGSDGYKYIWQKPGYNYESYRKNERKVVSLDVEESSEEIYLAIYDLKHTVKLEAVLSLITTFLVCTMLGVGAALFSKMTTDLVITPIEDMIMRVNNITADPLGAAHQEEERLLFEELAEKDKAHKSMESYDQKITEKKNQIKQKTEPMETAMLESTLSKIGALLALGFGEAGSEVIAKNMAQGGDVNPMLPGIKLMSIFGFCDIRNFTDATEVLQEGVMLFVNEIGEIIHGMVDKYSGAANKNIGDAFLLVWKFENDMQQIDKQTGQLFAKESSKVAQLADMSVVSFLLCIAEIRKSSKLTKYNNHKGLKERLGDNFQVKLGMGLHLGYAIEGAIGSYYKIDASYLSPHVKMPERLESSTKAYGVPLLISGTLYSKLTRATRNFCRQVDWVTMVGSDEPVRFYTVDIDPQQLIVESHDVYLSQKERKIQRVHDRIKRDNLREAAFKCQIQISDTFDQHKDLLAMRKPFKKEFFTTYNKAFKQYVKGNWELAKIGFLEVLRLSPYYNQLNDIKDPEARRLVLEEQEEELNRKLVSFNIDPETKQPMEKMILENAKIVIEPVTERLLRFMSQTEFRAPPDWKGYKFFGE